MGEILLHEHFNPVSINIAKSCSFFAVDRTHIRDIFKHFSLLPFFRRRLSFLGRV